VDENLIEWDETADMKQDGNINSCKQGFQAFSQTLVGEK